VGIDEEVLNSCYCCAGNDFFKQQKYPEAVKHYTEALRRNPKDPKVTPFSIAGYTMLCASGASGVCYGGFGNVAHY
jgi:hypothetical protein